MAKDEPNEDAGLAAAFDKATQGMELEDGDFQAAADAPAEEAVDTPEPEAEEQAEAKPEPKAKPVAKALKTRGKEQAALAETPSAPVEAPANWDAKRKEAFGKLPSEAKALVLDMAKSAEVDAAKQKPLVDYGRAVAGLVTDQHRQQMAAGGFKNEVEGLAHLIRLSDWAANRFPEYGRWAFQQYAGNRPIAEVLQEVFPEAFTGTVQPGNGQAQPQPQARPQTDPRLNQVYETTRQTAERLARLEERDRALELRTADNAIDRFRNEKDDAGNLRHPHFAAVEDEITRLLQSRTYDHIEDKNQRLAEAYDAAVAKVPEIRKQYLDGELARMREADRQAADLARARKARAPINAAPSGPARTTPRGLDAAIGQAMNLVGG